MSYDEVTAGTAAAMHALAAVNLTAAHQEAKDELEDEGLPRSAGDGDATSLKSTSAPPSAAPVPTATAEFLARERRRWNPTLGDESVPMVGEFKYPLETPLAGWVGTRCILDPGLVATRSLTVPSQSTSVPVPAICILLPGLATRPLAECSHCTSEPSPARRILLPGLATRPLTLRSSCTNVTVQNRRILLPGLATRFQTVCS
jgi:hypothetical protein